ncbi:response regulator transcription factor [Cohnella hongkongensis]|uniref:Response regulator n=1 Tax=Cohnella hongkongensis TaxID=178337 RepID=A0ABV9FC47_9BACL
MLKVLIVEDEEIIRKGLVHTIDWLSMGCVIVGDAGDGFEGLRLFEEHRPDLVITDIMMPHMNGIEMLEKMTNRYPFHSVILTSYTEFEYAQQAISLRVSEYLLKPVNEAKLLKIIEAVKSEVSQEKAFGDIAEKVKQNSEFNLAELDVYMSADSRVNYYVGEAIKQIQAHYQRKISVESIAKDLGISPSYLSRKFRETTSQTFLEILNKYRIQKAVELLHTQKYRMNEISDKTGFSEYKHFCSVFKKYTRMSPSDFQKAGNWVMVKRFPHGTEKDK